MNLAPTAPPVESGIQDKTRHQSALAILAAADVHEPEVALRLILRVSADALGVDRVGYWTVRRKPLGLGCASLYVATADRYIAGSELRACEAQAYFAALGNDSLITVNDVMSDPRARELAGGYLRPCGIGAFMHVSVPAIREMQGVLSFEHVGGRREWTIDEQLFARFAGMRIALMLAQGQHREAEQMFRESDQRFHVTCDQAAFGVASISLEGEVQWANRHLNSVLGIERPELLGCSIEEFLSPDDYRRYTELIQRVREGLVSKATTDLRLRSRDGVQLWVNVVVTVRRNAADEPESFILVVHDLADRKRAEARVEEHANLLDLTRDAVVVRDLCDTVQFWNRGAELLYGIPALAAVGAPVVDLVATSSEGFARAKEAVLEQDSWNGELFQQTRDGRNVVVDARWTLVRDELGRPKSILTISTDITERKSLQQQFLRAQRLESIGTLASGLAHDLNNILSPILMSAPLLTDVEDARLRGNLVQTIESAARRGSDIVRKVLTFARGVEGERMPVPVSYVIQEMAKIAGETFPKSITVTRSYAPDLWPVVGDSTQLHQVLMNLCVNARDAMPEGGTLSMTAENRVIDESYAATTPQATAGPHVLIEVRDTGTGMSPPVLEKAFDPFFTTKQSEYGTGLGLSTVIGIVRSHGGFVRVESEVGRGTCFQIFLPAIAQQQVTSPPLPVPDSPRGHGQLVLLVDDEAGVRTVAAAVLERHGYRVVCAEDGAAALTEYTRANGAVDVVLTDVVMPEMDGVNLARTLKKMNPAVRIIAASGHLSDARYAELKALGIPVLLKKPFTAAKLLETLHDVVNAA
jgi:two-component system, cell cycle sensor histidine kinase and response regulator CckA